MKIKTILLLSILWTNLLFSQQFKPAVVNPFGISTGSFVDFNTMHFVDIDQDEDFDIVFEDADNAESLILLNQGTNGSPDFSNYPVEEFHIFDDGTYIGEGLFSLEVSSTFIDLDGDSDLDNLATTSSDDPAIPAEFGIFPNLIEMATEPNALFVFDADEDPGSDIGLPELSINALQLIRPIDIDNDSDLDVFSIRYNELDDNVDFLLYESLFSQGTNIFSGIEMENPFGFSTSDFSAFGVPAFLDVDNDNDQDLLVLSFDGDWQYYENIGTSNDPSFNNTPTINPFGLTPLDGLGFPAAIDVNADGRKDLIVGYQGAVYYYEFDFETTTKDFETEETLAHVFPNPSTGLLNVQTFKNSITNIKIRSLLNKEIMSKSLNPIKQLTLNVEYLSAGTYTIEIEFDNQTKVIKPLMIVR